MRLAWESYGGTTNNFDHEENRAAIDIRRQAIQDRFARRYGTVENWTITGVILRDTVAALSAQMSALEDAYSFNEGNLILYDGETATEHQMLSAGSITGTQVVSGPNWLKGYPGGLWGMGTEYVNRRTYQIGVQAVAHSGLIGAGDVIDYSERQQVRGIGAKYEWAGSLTGVPIRHELQQQDTYALIQRGYRVTYGPNPPPNTPVDPANLMSQDIQYHTPRYHRNGAYGYRVDWTYMMERTASFVSSFPAFTP